MDPRPINGPMRLVGLDEMQLAHPEPLGRLVRSGAVGRDETRMHRGATGHARTHRASDAHRATMLQKRVDALEQEKDALGRFAGMAAHELMEPLIMAEAYAMQLADEVGDRLTRETRADLENLLRGASRMRLIVETLLHDARSSGQPLQRKPVDLGQIVREGIELLRHELRSHDATLKVGPLPVVQGDAMLLSGVISNLLLNAVRYGPSAGGEIEVSARQIRNGSRIAVSSRGPTIAGGDRERIFEAFCRGTHERRVHGSGLGLSICRSIVERHDGRIGVRPLRPHGNEFFFTIPDERVRRPVSPRGLGVAASARPLPGAI
jgi:signal transduction histidine kinase